jgi:RNA polymerase sigma-70 factor (ECF subfamily)
MTDAGLVHLVLAGDGSAFAMLVERHFARAYRYAFHVLGDAFDAEEVVQDSFMRAHRALARYEERERFEAWFYRILLNQCRTRLAQRKRRTRMLVSDETVVLRAPDPKPAAPDDWNEEIRLALAQLPTEQREAFLLRYVDEMGYDEMSSLLGAGVSALKMRVKRACDRMRELLGEVTDARS